MLHFATSDPSAVTGVFALMVQAGPDWVLYLLSALGVLSLGVSVERLWTFRATQGDVGVLAKHLEPFLYNQAYALGGQAIEALPSSIACVARAGLSRASDGPSAAKWAMQAAFAHERKRLETRLTILSTLGTNAPFVGLFGTVVGIVLAFEQLGQGHSGGTSPAVMAAIAEALVATAVGIGVALPCVAAYNYFQRRISAISDDVDALSSFILSYLHADQGDALNRGQSA